MEPDRLFDIPDAPPPAPRESADARRTRRRAEMLAAGIHPRTRLPLIANADATCGNCAHHFERRMASTYHKCDHGYAPGTYRNGNPAPPAAFVSGGPATDVRVNWPACTAWKPEPVEDTETS